MKKTVLLLPVLLFLLTGCKPTTDESSSTIELTKQSYQTYVTISYRSEYAYSSFGDQYFNYYADFSGSDICKFTDCKFLCCWVNANGQGLSSYVTVKLTISGDGEANVLTAREGSYHLSISEVKGTVEIIE